MKMPLNTQSVGWEGHPSPWLLARLADVGGDSDEEPSLELIPTPRALVLPRVTLGTAAER